MIYVTQPDLPPVKDFSALPRGLSLAARLLPPNVYYLEVPTEAGTLRCKYALLTQRQFLRGCSRLAAFPYFWARYAQPMSLLACEHGETRALLASAMLGAAETLLVRTLPVLPAGPGGKAPILVCIFWYGVIVLYLIIGVMMSLKCIA